MSAVQPVQGHWQGLGNIKTSPSQAQKATCTNMGLTAKTEQALGKDANRKALGVQGPVQGKISCFHPWGRALQDQK